MVLKQACLEKGGIWDHQIGCKLREENPETGEVFDRIYYDTTENKCSENGDEYVDFFKDIKACKEISVREFCDKNMDSVVYGLHSCAREVTFPEKKFYQAIKEAKNIIPTLYRHQDFNKDMKMESMNNEELDMYLNDFYKHIKLRKDELEYALRKERKKIEKNINKKTFNKKEIVELSKNLSGILSRNNLTESQIFKVFDMFSHLDIMVDVLDLDVHEKMDLNYKGNYSESLVKNQKLSDVQVNMLLNRGRELDVIYKHVKLNDSQIETALEIGEKLVELYRYQKLSRGQIDNILEFRPNKINQNLYIYQDLNRDQIYKAIENRVYITSIISSQKLNLKQISMVLHDYLGDIDVMDELLIKWGNKFNTEQRFYVLDHAKSHTLHIFFIKVELRQDELRTLIEKGEHLPRLVRYQKLSNDNIKLYIDQDRELHLLYNWADLDKEMIDYAIENGTYLDRIIKRYGSKLTNTQVDKIIEQGKSLTTLYSNWDWRREKHILRPYQVDAAVEKGIALDALADNYELNKEQINFILENASDTELSDFFKVKSLKLSKEQVNYAIERGAGTDGLFENFNLLPFQKYRAIDAGHNLSELYLNHELTEKMIDKAIEKGKDLAFLYGANKSFWDDPKHVLTKEQVDTAIEKGKALEHLYREQKLTARQITKAIDKEKNLNVLLDKYKFTPSQKDKILELGKKLKPITYSEKELSELEEKKIEELDDLAKTISTLFDKQKLSKKQIIKATDIGYDLDALYRNTENKNLGEENYLKIIEKSHSIKHPRVYALYENHAKHFTWPVIEKAIDDAGIGYNDPKKADSIDVLYKHINVNSEEINKILDKGVKTSVLVREKLNDFTQNNFNKAIEKEISLNEIYRYDLNRENINKAIEKEKHLNILYSHQELTDDQIANAMNKGKNLHELYEHQHLDHKHIEKALEIGEEIDNLWTYHKTKFKEKDIDMLIDKKQLLHILQKSSLVSNEQKLRILEILGVSKEVVSKSKFLREVPPDLIPRAKEILDEAKASRLKEHPLEPAIGEYEIPKTPWQEIIERVEKEGWDVKNEKFAYKGTIKKKIGGLLSTWKEDDLLKKYQIIRSQHTPIPEDYEDLYIEISDDPEDIAMKSTGQKWTSCETVCHGAGGGEHLKGNHNGWRDDIQFNNLIAYIKRKKEKKPLARCMIRWCHREDDGLPDAFVEDAKSAKEDAKYRQIIKKNVIDILQKKGFSAIKGPVKCVTPYDFTGYVDEFRAYWNDKPITYNVAKKPIEVKNR